MHVVITRTTMTINSSRRSLYIPLGSVQSSLDSCNVFCDLWLWGLIFKIFVTGAGPSSSATPSHPDTAPKIVQIKEVMGDTMGDGYLHACLHAYNYEPEQVSATGECP